MSNFKIWIDNPIGGTNVVVPETFADDVQRQNGFKAGTGASSILVNTGMRQSTLITAALMETIGESADNLSVLSTLDDVKNVINTYMLNSSSRTVEFTQESSRTNLTSGETLSRSLGKISRYFSDLDNPNAVGCQKANIANYASSDTSKGTIEERLTNLGFKTGSTTTGEFRWTSTAQNYLNIEQSYVTATRQGNYVILDIKFVPKERSWCLQFFTNGFYMNFVEYSDLAYSETFRPKTDQKFTIGGLFNGIYYYLGGGSDRNWTMCREGVIYANHGYRMIEFELQDNSTDNRAANRAEFTQIKIGYEANPL